MLLHGKDVVTDIGNKTVPAICRRIDEIYLAKMHYISLSSVTAFECKKQQRRKGEKQSRNELYEKKLPLHNK